MFGPQLLQLFVLTLIICPRVFGQRNTTHVTPEYNHALRLNLSNLPIVYDRYGNSINCTNCYIHGDFSFATGSADALPDSNFSSLPFNFQQSWAAAVVDDFTAHFELDFSVVSPPPGKVLKGFEGLIPHFRDGIGFQTGILLVGIGWNFNPTIYALVNSSTAVNFTYGFEFTIPANSGVFVPLDDGVNAVVQSAGFNRSKITPLNYTSPDANEDFDFEISFRPQFTVSLQAVFGFIKVLSATVFADVPKLDVAVNQVNDVTRDCKPAPAGTASDLVFDNLTYVVPTSSYDIGFDIGVFGGNVFEKAYPLGNKSTLQTNCLMYSPNAHALVAVPEPVKKGNPTKSEGQRSGVAAQAAVVGAIAIVIFNLL